MKPFKPEYFLAFALIVEAVSLLVVFGTQTGQAARIATAVAVALQVLAAIFWKKRTELLPVTAVALSGMIWFFYIVYAPIDLAPRVLAAVATLVLTGFALHKITGQECFYGFLMVRSFAGFDVMQSVAHHHPRFSREAADFGAAMTFGLPWAYHAYGLKKTARQAVVLVALVGLLTISNFLSALSILWSGGEIYFAAVGLLFGFIGLGVLGMAVHSFNVLTVPNTPPGVQLLIPFVTVPGEALFAIAVIAIVHEMAHGVLAYVEKLKLKSSGVLLFGFLPVGAFVEPDENKLDSLPLEKKRRILVAGSTSNALFFVIFFAIAMALALLVPMTVAGVKVDSVPANSTLSGVLLQGASLIMLDGQPVESTKGILNVANLSNNPKAVFVQNGTKIEARLMELVVQAVNKSGPSNGILAKGDRIAAVDGKSVSAYADFNASLGVKKPGEAVTITTSAGNKTIILGADGKLGIAVSLTSVAVLNNKPKEGMEKAYAALAFLLTITTWTYLLNILIAVVNLLPLFITDGQKLVFYELERVFGKKKAMLLATIAGLLVLGLILINALPYFLGK